MIRIWHQSFTDLSTVPLYAATLDAHAKQIMPSDVVVVPHGLVPGTYAHGVAPIDAIRHRYLEFLNEGQVCEAALAAEREGFAAMAIGCFFDPALRAARSIVDIPVVSLAESCMLIACSLGRAFGIVTLCGDETDNLADLARQYGVSGRLASVVGLEPAIDEFALEAEEATAAPILANFQGACEAALRAGAEVIIPGDGVLNEFLVRQGCTRVGDVPVLDSIGVLFYHAEMLVRLQRSTGLGVSRRQFYAKPPAEMLAEARKWAGTRELGSDDFSAVALPARTRWKS